MKEEGWLSVPSFRDLIAHAGVVARKSRSTLEALECVDLLVTICEIGDRVLALAQRQRIASDKALALLAELLTCFADPIKNTQRIRKLGKEMRGYDI